MTKHGKRRSAFMVFIKPVAGSSTPAVATTGDMLSADKSDFFWMTNERSCCIIIQQQINSSFSSACREQGTESGEKPGESVTVKPERIRDESDT